MLNILKSLRLAKFGVCSLVFLLTLLVFSRSEAKAQELPYSNNQIANAIYKAEGGAKTNHPYGILVHYKHTSARQACLNTIIHAKRDWNGKGDFITFLGARYCPVGCNNDIGTNRYWITNVHYFLEKEVKDNAKG